MAADLGMRIIVCVAVGFIVGATLGFSGDIAVATGMLLGAWCKS